MSIDELLECFPELKDYPADEVFKIAEKETATAEFYAEVDREAELLKREEGKT